MDVILIDGRNAMFRFGWVGRNLSSRSGEDTGALHGLLTGMLALKRRFPLSKFVVCWDGQRGQQNWRLKIFSEYKANRRATVLSPEQQLMREKIGRQIHNVKELLSLISISQIEVPELEADDVVGVLADKLISSGHKPYVFSNDQDYLQLVALGVNIITSVSSPLVDEKYIRSKFRCVPANVLKVRALIGDKSDGIPRAIPGVGPISAAKYIDAGVDPSTPSFEDLPRSVRMAYARIESYWPTVHMNWRLMRILSSCSDHELPADLSARFAVDTRRVLKQLLQRRIAASHTLDTYELFLRKLAELDLREAMSARVDIWHLQTVF